VMVAQLREHTKATELCTLGGWIFVMSGWDCRLGQENRAGPDELPGIFWPGLIPLVGFSGAQHHLCQSKPEMSLTL
jgi:hypothetical protein